MPRSKKYIREPKRRPLRLSKWKIPAPNRQANGMPPTDIRGGILLPRNLGVGVTGPPNVRMVGVQLPNLQAGVVRPPNVQMMGMPVANLQARVMLPPVAQIAGIPQPNVQGWRIPPPNALARGVPPNLQVMGMPPVPAVMGIPPGIDPDSPPRENLTPVPNWLLYRPRRVGEWVWPNDSIKSFLAAEERAANLLAHQVSRQEQINRFFSNFDGALDVFSDLLNCIITDVASEEHRAAKLDFDNRYERNDHPINFSELTFDSFGVDTVGSSEAFANNTRETDVFGALDPGVRASVECPVCVGIVEAGIFAAHLEKCMDNVKTKKSITECGTLSQNRKQLQSLERGKMLALDSTPSPASSELSSSSGELTIVQPKEATFEEAQFEKAQDKESLFEETASQEHELQNKLLLREDDFAPALELSYSSNDSSKEDPPEDYSSPEDDLPPEDDLLPEDDRPPEDDFETISKRHPALDVFIDLLDSAIMDVASEEHREAKLGFHVSYENDVYLSASGESAEDTPLNVNEFGPPNRVANGSIQCPSCGVKNIEAGAFSYHLKKCMDQDQRQTESAYLLKISTSEERSGSSGARSSTNEPARAQWNATGSPLSPTPRHNSISHDNRRISEIGSSRVGSPAECQASPSDWIQQQHWTDSTQRNTERIDPRNLAVETPPSPPSNWFLQQSTDLTQLNMDRIHAENPTEHTSAVNLAFLSDVVLQEQSTDPIQRSTEPTFADNPTVETPPVHRAFPSDCILEEPNVSDVELIENPYMLHRTLSRTCPRVNPNVISMDAEEQANEPLSDGTAVPKYLTRSDKKFAHELEMIIGSADQPMDNESMDVPHVGGPPQDNDSRITSNEQSGQRISFDLLDSIRVEVVSEQRSEAKLGWNTHFERDKRLVTNPRVTVKPQPESDKFASLDKNTKAEVQCLDCGKTTTPGRIARHWQKCSFKVSAPSQDVRQSIVYIMAFRY